MNGLEKWQNKQIRSKRTRRLEKGIVFSIISSIGSFLVIIFAFLIPSFEEQYDRFKSHEVLEQYVKIGYSLYKKEFYSEAEKVFEKAFEFSENQRLDIEKMRLRSRVFKIYENDEWSEVAIEDLSEGDFLFLIEDTKDKKELSTLKSALGTYLTFKKEITRGFEILKEARELDPYNLIALVNLGNAYSDKGQDKMATSLYQEALKLRPNYYEALYNLGVLYYNKGECSQAKSYLLKAQKIQKHPNFYKVFHSCFKGGE